MAETLFDIFGNNLTKPLTKNVGRQRLFNNENIGKAVISSGPIKPNEPLKKKDEKKKTFFSNTGKALQPTPVQKGCSPRLRSLNSARKVFDFKVMYDDAHTDDIEELQFTKPKYDCNNYHKDMLDCYLLPEPDVPLDFLPSTPPPTLKLQPQMQTSDYNCCDDFFSDLSNESLAFEDDPLPELY